MTPASQDATGRFENPDGRRPRGLWDVVRWKLRLGPREASEVFPDGQPLPYRPDLASVELARIHAPDPARLQATWVGHATWLLQIGGVNLLTDPQWSERASPVSWTGPRRIAPPALRFEDLPPIQAVLLSHNHYDHLDRPTVRRLVAREADRLCFYVPLGLGRWISRLGRRLNVGLNVVELNWGDAVVVANGSVEGRTTFRCVPAQHWSSRTPFDRRKTLWCGWVVDHHDDAPDARRRVYFAGDTGWADGVFDCLGREHGPFDLALLPIGAYAPRWFMADQHADPRDAMRIHRAVRALRSLGMHWGTFVLTDEPPAEPPQLLAKATGEAGIPQEEFRAARLGETMVI